MVSTQSLIEKNIFWRESPTKKNPPQQKWHPSAWGKVEGLDGDTVYMGVMAWYIGSSL